MTAEADIEERLITKLTDLKYTYRDDIPDRASLERNFRAKFETLNRVHLTDSEFERLLEEIINPDIFISSKNLRQINTFLREDGTHLDYTLVNIKDWCKNEFEVISQLRINTSNSHHRYDVILLINGLPVVQIELKAWEVSPRRAMQQIVDYKNDPGNGYTNSLLCFIQLFIVSNETDTFYFANNRNQYFSFNADEQFLPVYRYADEKNKKITHLHDFSHRFLAKCTLGEIISRYMVLVESEQRLLVMRPYQIYAVKAIVDCIHQNRGNGYIWHTTGSGKTLTSFKASTLLKDNPDIEKCLFVVDRKDLDRQTREEFNKFQEGCVEQNTNTDALVKRMLSQNTADKVIVTTIQKLGLALDSANKRNYKERLKSLSNKRMVFIFDECHRSQFGDNHKAIKDFFPNAQLFGFTGTPIFEKNAIYTQREGEQESYKTTLEVFQKELHAYTITHAIEDGNVLRFHVDYFKADNNIAIGDSRHKDAVVKAIIDKHNAATNSCRFNALLATASINDAIEYYHLFKDIQEEEMARNGEYSPLNIACVFSPPAEGNKDAQQYQEDLLQEKEDNKKEPEKKKKALKSIIADYNSRYHTNHKIDEFDLYYQDIQKRIKDQKYTNADYARENKIDVMIVVDMLLTGFDSHYLNTLYVDKNLKHHGLIQAFSRTNRILNNTKPYGNILDFRKQEKLVDEAITIFSGEKVEKAKEIWLVDTAPVVLIQYEKAIGGLQKFMKGKGLKCEAKEVSNLMGDKAKGEFIAHFKKVQRLKIQLEQYTDLKKEQRDKIKELLPEEQLRAFRGIYLDTAKELKKNQDKSGDEANPVNQLDFELVLFASAVIDYDYIMGLIAKFTQQGKPSRQSMTREDLINILSSSANLMDEREDIIAYVNSLPTKKSMTENEVREGYTEFKAETADKELAEIARKNGLKIASLKEFVETVISRMIFDGEQLNELFAPFELNWKERAKKETELMTGLMPHLNKLAKGREISGLKAYEETTK